MTQTSFSVGNGTSLEAVFQDISSGPDYAPNTAYTITLTASISLLSSASPSITIPPGSSVTLTGPFIFISDAFAVTGGTLISDLNFTGTITLDNAVFENAAAATNTGGTIIAGLYSGAVLGTAADAGDTAINNGTITYAGPYAAIQLDTGTVQNGWGGPASAFVSGDAGAIVLQTGGLVQNGGTVVSAGTDTAAIYLGAGTVDNGQPGDTTASITGGFNGVEIAGAGAVNNDGTITGVASDAVYLGSGSVNNGEAGVTTAQIIGGPGDNAVWIASGSGTVSNFGTITGGSVSGVYLQAGGTLANGTSSDLAAAISGGGEGVLLGQAGTVLNYGLIQAVDPGVTSSAVGAFLANGGTLQNLATSAVVSGANWGVLVEASAGNVSNIGTVQATGAFGYGVDLTAGGTVINGLTAGASALITGGFDGVRIAAGAAGAGATVLNDGTIQGSVGVDFLSGAVPATGTLVNAGLIASTAGTAGYAVEFGNGSETLVLQPTGSFNGSVLGNNASGSSTTLELAAGTQGSLSGLANDSGTVTDSAGSFAFSQIGTVALDAGAMWSIATSGTLDTVSNAGSLAIAGAADTITGSLSNAGVVAVNGGTLTVGGSLLSSGTIGIGISSAVTLQSGVANGETLQFNSGGTQEYLALGSPSDVAGPILDFGQGRTIDLLNTQVTSLQYAGGTLTALNGGVTVAALDLPGPFTTSSFQHLADLGTGTFITAEGTPCYCRGTLILTDRGELPVEDLRIGDGLITRSGAVRPIRWIGRRSYAGRFAAGNRDVLPIQIGRDALGDDVPRRDLFVSPLHAMFLDDVLIPAAALVNGRSIVQMEWVEQVEYFHLELATHDVIFAEGAPSETFVDDDSRGMFQNAAEYAALYPDAARTAARFCAPRLEDGETVEAIRQRLAARSAQPQQPEPLGSLAGSVDFVSHEAIEGWALDATQAETPVRLRILDNDVVIGEAIADCPRPDLQRSGIGNGHHSFRFEIPGGLSPVLRHVVRVQRVADQQDLPHSPWVVPERALAVVTPSAPAAGLRGMVDLATRERVAGWAYDELAPGQPVALQILDNGRLVARVLANRYRHDLAPAGIGSGRHAFDILIPAGLSPLVRHVIQVVRESDGAMVPGSPHVIEAADSFDPDFQRAVTAAVEAAGGSDASEHVLSFLLAQADRIRQLQADSDSQRAARLLKREPQAARANRRALLIDERWPDPGRDAGSRAVLSHARAMQQLGYDVSLVAADEMEQQPAALHALAAQNITPCAAPLYASVEDVLRRQADCFDTVYLHRASIATRYLSLARRYMPRARIIYSVADLHHVRLARQAAAEQVPSLLAASRRQWLEECMAACSADAVLTHSSDELEILRQAVPAANLHHVAWHVPARDPMVPFAARHGVAFIGGYRHAPNVDAAIWLVETIMPLVWAVRPEITCLLAGSEMPQAVAKLAGPRVSVLGHVLDLAGLLDRVRLTVAPLRFGAGVKGKVLDSLGAGVPCVMSPVAAEGLALPVTLQRLAGADAQAIAALICRLHDNRRVHANAARSGLAFIRDRFNEATVTAALKQAIEGGRMQDVTGSPDDAPRRSAL